jgi:hypothetical protein
MPWTIDSVHLVWPDYLQRHGPAPDTGGRAQNPCQRRTSPGSTEAPIAVAATRVDSAACHQVRWSGISHPKGGRELERPGLLTTEAWRR